MLRLHLALLLILLVALLGFGAMMFQIDQMDRSFSSLQDSTLPREVVVSSRDGSPVALKIEEMPGMPPGGNPQKITFTKDIPGIGTVEWDCFREPGEALTAWAARCRSEWAEICDGLEG